MTHMEDAGIRGDVVIITHARDDMLATRRRSAFMDRQQSWKRGLPGLLRAGGLRYECVGAYVGVAMVVPGAYALGSVN